MATQKSLRPFTVGFCLLSLFYVTLVLGTATSIPVQPAQAPDERHHFALVVFFLEHPLFDFDRGDVFTDRARFNHLVHPPFYYYLIARAAEMVFPALGPDYFSKDAAEFKTQSIFWIRAFRFLSIALFSPIYLAGVYLCLRKLISAHICTNAAALVLFLLWSFLASRLLVAAEVSDDAMALAAWPWLLYVVLGALFGAASLRQYFLLTIAAISGALMSKATLIPLSAMVTAVALYGATRIVPEQSSLPAGSGWRFYLKRWQGIISTIGVIWIVIGMAILALPLTSMLIDYARYGTITPLPQQIYPHIEAAARHAYNKTLLENPMTLWALGAEILDRMWRSTVGVYGHRFYFVTGSGPINGPTFFWWSVLVMTVAVFFAAATDKGDRRDAWLLVAIGSAAYVLFMIFFIAQDYRLHLARGHFLAQGRYSIGYLELLLLATIALGEKLIWSAERRSRAWQAATRGAFYLALGLLVVLLARPWGLTGYSLFLASQDGSADALLRQRTAFASAMSFRGPGVYVHKPGLKVGRLGGYLDADVVALSSAASSFGISVVVSDGAKTGQKSAFLVSTDRSVRITAGPGKSVVAYPYEFALVPVELKQSDDPDVFKPVQLHISLDEGAIERLRDMWRPRTYVFVYGLIPEAGAETVKASPSDAPH